MALPPTSGPPPPGGLIRSQPSLAAHSYRWVAILVVTILVLGTVGVLVWLYTAPCSPSMPGDKVSFGPPVGSSSTNGHSFYENVSFSLASATYAEGACIPNSPTVLTVHLSSMEPAIAAPSSSGVLGLVPGAAACAPPENFSDCVASAGIWYLVLWNSSATIVSSFQATNNSRTWSAQLSPGTSVWHLTVVTPVDLRGSGDELNFNTYEGPVFFGSVAF